MKQKKQILNSILIGCLLAGVLGGCTGYETEVNENGMRFFVNTSGRKAFIADTEADPEERVVELPSKVKKAEITSVGGFFGTGVPCPFRVTLKGDYPFSSTDPADYGTALVSEDVPVTVVLSKPIETVKLLDSGGCYGNRTDTGYVLLKRPVLRFEAAENETVHVRDGRICNEDGTVKEWPADVYGDTEAIEKTLIQKISGMRYIVEVNERESEVWEFYEAFDRIFVHINSYMEGSEYMFSALELTPVEPDELNSRDADTFDVSVKQFSMFAMGGTYTEPDYPYCRITVTEDGLVLNGLNETRQPADGAERFLKADLSQPSQYPVSMEEYELRYEETAGREPLFNRKWYGLTSQVLENERLLADVYRDGTVNVLLKDRDSRLTMRGFLTWSGDPDDNDLCFSLRVTGGTTEPITGKIHVEVSEDGEITVTPIDGYDAEPFITADETYITLHHGE